MVANLRIAFVSTIRKFVMISYPYHYFFWKPAFVILTLHRPAFRSQELAAIGASYQRLEFFSPEDYKFCITGITKNY